jgi:alkylhydroperoxidase family enzyme
MRSLALFGSLLFVGFDIGQESISPVKKPAPLVKPGELEQAVAMLLLDQEPVTPKSRERLSTMTNEEAWKRLPGAPAAVQPLPVWARKLAAQLPVTTARMLELDALHRTGNRLDARLRGLARWAAADANGCEYAKAVAVADLLREGVPESEVHDLTVDATHRSGMERATAIFARKMMREAHAITDGEVKELLAYLGEERLVALVALLAHASFQDRIFLAVNVQVDSSGPLPPLTVSFGKPKPPAHQAASEVHAPSVTRTAAGQEWLDLQDHLDQQRARKGRIRIPSKEEVLKRMGPIHPGAWQADILWSRVCYGYQPELTDAWFDCVSALRQEANLDRILAQCIFWVVTRSVECFY